MATVLSIAPIPPSPIHSLNPPTPPTSSSPIFNFTKSISSSRPTTPTSICSPLDTPPASPSSDETASIESSKSSQTFTSEEPPISSYVLYPPTKHEIIRRELATVYAISASTLAQAYHHIRSQPLPPASDLFPWLHGLNPRNAGQLSFFSAQSPVARVPPINLGYRTITVVHVPAPFGCYRPGRLVGAVNCSEILGRSQRDCHFADPDPIKGICLRNFQIQTSKMALLSDIIVYSPRGGQNKEVMDVAEKIAHAQRLVRMKYSTNQTGLPQYNTFIVNGIHSRNRR
jgi:dual specificity MAP kinase phosphatase